MTVLSAGLGWATTLLSRVYTFYASVVLFTVFGVKLLKEAYEMSPKHGEARHARSPSHRCSPAALCAESLVRTACFRAFSVLRPLFPSTEPCQQCGSARVC